MRTWRAASLAAVSTALLVGITSVVLADNELTGTYRLTSRGASEVTLSISEGSRGALSVMRTARYPNRAEPLILTGTATQSGSGWLRVTFTDTRGIAASLDGSSASQATYSAVYRVSRASGRLYGLYNGPLADGRVARIYESGRRTGDATTTAGGSTGDNGGSTGNSGGSTGNSGGSTGGNTGGPSASAVRIEAPGAGAVLAGTTVPLRLVPPTATLAIEGPAQQTPEGLKITGPGSVRLVASASGQQSQPVELTALSAEVIQVEVQGGIAISDVTGPQFARDLGATEPSAKEPAALLKDQPLRLQVTLAAARDLAAPVQVTLTATAGDVSLSRTVELQRLSGQGQAVQVESSAPLSAAVKINELSLIWKVGETEVGTTPLRVYTVHRAPVHNISWDPTETATKRHFENACRWANGATRNIGQGADSIGYQIDNQMRHYVHWQDLGSLVPAVADYPQGAPAPLNYDDIEGWVSNGTRSISSLYYPPLEPTKDYEEYEHYRNNFGWQVLDNPTHTGGRCNQQASLVCAILGTVGIEGDVHYLERVGRGRRTGRPVRQYFYSNDGSSTGGGPWNFHGVALIDLDDGSQWIYDGSFSFPPRRKNGTKDWAEGPDGPFIKRWGPWYYTDVRPLGVVPDDDKPTRWQGVQLTSAERNTSR